MLNSWSDDWDKSYTTRITTETPTIDEIKAAVREFIARNNDRWPDVWVLTNDEYESLKQQCEAHELPFTRCPGNSSIFTVYGIRIEHYPSRQEVRARVLELADQGVKAGFIGENQ